MQLSTIDQQVNSNSKDIIDDTDAYSTIKRSPYSKSNTNSQEASQDNDNKELNSETTNSVELQANQHQINDSS